MFKKEANQKKIRKSVWFAIVTLSKGKSSCNFHASISFILSASLTGLRKTQPVQSANTISDSLEKRDLEANQIYSLEYIDFDTSTYFFEVNLTKKCVNILINNIY